MLVASILFLYCSMALWKNARHKIYLGIWVRYRSRFFVQVGHQSTCATIGYHHFSLLYHVIIVRPCKIINSSCKNPKFWFKNHYSVLKINGTFHWRPIEQLLLMTFFENFDFKILYFLKMCPIFVGSADNFGRSDDDMVK